MQNKENITLFDYRKEFPISELDYKFDIWTGGNFFSFDNNYVVYVGDTKDGIPNGEGIAYESA